MSDDAPTLTPARVRHAADLAQARVEPLFPTSRLLKRCVVEAESYAADRRRAADELVTVARTEAATIREQARADATAEYARAAQPIIDALARAVDAHAASAPTITQRAAFAIARRVLSAELAAKPEHLVNVLADVIVEARRYGELLICVHPDDHALVAAQIERMRPLLATARSVQVVADAHVARHAVRIDTEMGRYEDGVRQRLDQLEAIFTADAQGRS